MDHSHPLCVIDDAPDNFCTEFLIQPGTAFSVMLVADLAAQCNCHDAFRQHESLPARILTSNNVPGFMPRGI